MVRKFFVLTFSAIIILCITSTITFAYSEKVNNPKFFVNYSPAQSNRYHQPEHSRSIIETAGSARNFIAVFTKPDGVRILEHIKFTRTTTFSEKPISNHNLSQSPQQATSSFENKARRVEIHQDIQQRK